MICLALGYQWFCHPNIIIQQVIGTYTVDQYSFQSFTACLLFDCNFLQELDRSGSNYRAFKIEEDKKEELKKNHS